MTDFDSQCLAAFPEWLRSLPADVTALGDALAAGSLPEAARRPVAGALNYLFKSLDLIPDGIEDLGFLDDAIVLREAARASGGGTELLDRLAKDAELVTELLGADHERLARYVASLGAGSARGRTVDSVLGDAAVLAELHSDLRGWASGFVVPSFARDPKNLVKLRSFLLKKLPA
ncbi:MAG: DUF1232 domain-containing protein [Deltaproteobacteria bacterium]|nr:DUF1232 domain-containing protein [Deltaproteobacteria bacterium]